jgi:NAD(P)-dependent dehydrogenase (short-subunit alcohol dehydrogenase family)
MTEKVTTPFGARATARDVLEGVDLHGRRFLVTGGASGIGAETVKALAQAGGDVVMAVRDPKKAETLLEDIRRDETAGAVSAAALDLSDLRSVKQFTDDWEGRLNGFVANAGVMAVPTRELTAEGWELQLGTNYLGHFALALGLRPALIEGRARVAVVSSTAHMRSPFVFSDPQFETRPYERWSAYAQSKTADVLLAAGIADRWASDGITANSLMPGWITTNLQRHLDDETLRSMGAMNEAGERIDQEYFKTREQGAATSTLIVASPLLEGVTGRYFEDNQEADVIENTEGHNSGVAAHAIDSGIASQLWEYSEPTLRAFVP